MCDQVIADVHERDGLFAKIPRSSSAMDSDALPELVEWQFSITGKGFGTSFLFEEHDRYTWASFISNIGGTMGLVCGVSLVSLVHILFFCGIPAMHRVKAFVTEKKV